MTISPAQLLLVQRLLRQYTAASATPDRDAARNKLIALGPTLPPALELLIQQRGAVIDPAVYPDVLAQLKPVYEIIERLRTGSATQRRVDAARLVNHAAEAELTYLAVDRLANIVITEQEPLVWLAVLDVVAGLESQPAERIAYAAMTHPVAQIRRRACQYLEDHPLPRHAEMLLAALEDPDSSVVRAAVRALGYVGELSSAEPLKTQLVSADVELRVQAAASLARLGHASGPAALERLAYHGDESIRRQAAAAMGWLKEARFTAALVRLLEDQPSVRRAALEALPRVVGQDIPAQQKPPAANPAEKVQQWKQWYREQGGVVQR